MSGDLEKPKPKGTMGFKAFSQIAGIDHYYGKEDYPNKGDFDGNWGIFDEPYLQYYSEQLSSMKEPFFSGIFTLSSHHPYTIPDQYENEFPKGSLPIHESIGYTDYSLQQFFIAAEKTDWFENTLFIITADHTQENVKSTYSNLLGAYRVPIAYYCPKNLKDTLIDKVTQQLDIFPTTIDILGIEGSFVNFGQSALDSNKPFSISYINGIYQYIESDYVLHFNGEQSIGFFNWRKDKNLKKNLVKSNSEEAASSKGRIENRLKAYLQQYQKRIVNNKMTYENK